ncbi:uncharacterized protein si:ch211-214p13.8 isoform X1 [Scophthalmus maximus]|uniref:uncharacterized protein si:ch211-214p13.8 isoform X1 n=2 Tax=Scophthalmus maximus TaxID=52904 RepID=UPI001FA89E69|nr:uncharacterized protein si:ch211-214p13.8 isoform X1 [Scophthalmus maximus]
MDRLPYTCLMMFSLFVSIHGIRKGSSHPCRVDVMVRRGTTLKIAPHQPLSVGCPVRHCGTWLSVTWCKILDRNRCERMKSTENVEIRQKDGRAKDELISYLTFKRISAHDDGLYKCYLEAYEYESISHTINISVSDIHQGVESTDNSEEVVSLSTAGDEAGSWLPYVYICGGIALLVFSITALTHLHFHGCKQMLTHKPTKGQETSAHMLPALPKWGAPSAPVEQAHFVRKAPPSPRPAGSPPCPIAGGKQPLAGRTAEERQASPYAVYAVINHAQTGIPARKHHAATGQDKPPGDASAKYTVVKRPAPL